MEYAQNAPEIAVRTAKVSLFPDQIRLACLPFLGKVNCSALP
jgi:hypothetical protein